MKASFVAGFIVIITIFKELYEYFRSELPLYVNGIYVLLCLILMLGILGTEKFDKYLNSKGVENFGTSLIDVFCLADCRMMLSFSLVPKQTAKALSNASSVTIAAKANQPAGPSVRWPVAR